MKTELSHYAFWLKEFSNLSLSSKNKKNKLLLTLLRKFFSNWLKNQRMCDYQVELSLEFMILETFIIKNGKLQ